MLREETATVLPFRDAAMRRPIDVVAWMDLRTPFASDPTDAHDNVVPLARFTRAARRAGVRTWFGGPPEGDAA